MKKVILITGGEGKISKGLSGFLKSGNFVFCPSKKDLDITDCESISTYVKKIINKHKRIDVLINGAGVMFFDSYENNDIITINKMMSVNFNGVVNVMYSVLPYMKSENYGHIINISSVRGITPAPNKSGYCASKFALQGFVGCLRAELKNTGIKITNICPGKVDESVTCEDINKTVEYILSLSKKTFIRDIILGGYLCIS